MFEVPHARKNHRQAVLVGGGYNFVVADRSAWLNYGRDSVARCFVDAVAKWEERIGREHRACHRKLRTHRANLHRINARHLSRSNAYRLVLACIDDRVGFRVLADRPREQQRSDFFFVGFLSVTTFSSLLIELVIVRSLDEHAAADLFDFKSSGSFRRVHTNDTKILLRSQDFERLRIVIRRDHDLSKDLRHFLRRRSIDGAIESDDSAEGRNRIGRECLS